jgi:hypothetical protein
MKSARYKLEAFIRDYSDMAEWKEVIEAIKTQLGAKHLFHPSAGIWPLKSRTSGPFDDLIASMLTFGWIEEMPAILDEYGVVIDGNRRMIVAELIGIEPVTKTARRRSARRSSAMARVSDGRSRHSQKSLRMIDELQAPPDPAPGVKCSVVMRSSQTHGRDAS